MITARIGDLQQCRYCRAAIRLIPYHARPDAPLQWGAFIEAPPLQLAQPLSTYQTGEAYVTNNGASRVVAGPFHDGTTELPLLIPHNCPNRAKAEAKRRSQR